MRQYLTLFFLVAVVFCNCMFGDTSDHLYKKGVECVKSGNTKKAFKFFKNAAQKSPDSARYYFAAAQTAPDQNASYMYTKFSWEKGLKNRTVLSYLLRLSFHIDKAKKLEYALSLFDELPDSLAGDVFKGDLFFTLGKPDSAYAYWIEEFNKTGKSFLCAKIANSLAQNGKPEEGIDFLYQCKKDKKIDSEGLAYLASLLSVKYNFKEVERLFSEVAATNYYTDHLRMEYATYCTFHDNFDKAKKLIAQPAGPGSKSNKAKITLRFQTLSMYSALMQLDTATVKSLLKKSTATSVFGKKQDDLFSAIGAYIRNDTAAYALIRKTMITLPPDPVTLIFCADAAARKGLYNDAAKLYKQLPGIVLWAPRIVVARARILALAEKDDEALKVVSYMHKHRIFTRGSLELYRNITLKKDLLEKSRAAQNLLEKQYSDDVGLRWKGLLLAIKSEQYDSALSISQQLKQKFPSDSRFTLTELSLLLLKKKYQMVLDKTAKSKLPAVKIKPIEALAYKGIGDTMKAIAAYRSVMEKRRDPVLVMQLAELYYQKKMFKEAKDCYSKLIKESTDSLSKDSEQLAIVLNNNAWTIMTAGTDDLSGAQAMAKRAFEIASDNLHIVDTYVSILFEAGNYKKCIEIVEGNNKFLSQKRLLCHLAKAYEKKGNKNKAKRYFSDALLLKNADQKLSLLLSNEQIKNEIARLSE